MHFSNNIKYLRHRRKKTQADIAFALQIKRSTLSGYENGIAEPGINTLLKLAEYYKIAIDTLLKIDLTKLSETQLNELEAGSDIYLKGKNIRILATQVNSQNEEQIELVSEKAKAGYTTGYADTEYIKQLPILQLPFLDKQKTYRCFQISGDSMLPIQDKSYIIAEYVQDWNNIPTNTPCVFNTLEDGIVFKILGNKITPKNNIKLISLNKLYNTYETPISNIQEIWKFTYYIGKNYNTTEFLFEQINQSIKKMHEETAQIKKILKH